MTQEMLMMRNKSELKNQAKRHAKQKRERVGLEWRANLWPIWPGRIPHGQDLASYLGRTMFTASMSRDFFSLTCE